jgi:beta-galactosidase
MSDPFKGHLMKTILHVARHMGSLALLICANAILAQSPSPAISSTVRVQLSLDRGWLFHEGDIPFPVINGHQQSYNNAKAGTSWGAAAPDFDDSSWQQVDLPHDWSQDAP